MQNHEKAISQSWNLLNLKKRTKAQELENTKRIVFKKYVNFDLCFVIEIIGSHVVKLNNNYICSLFLHDAYFAFI